VREGCAEDAEKTAKGGGLARELQTLFLSSLFVFLFCALCETFASFAFKNSSLDSQTANFISKIRQFLRWICASSIEFVAGKLSEIL
jgi:hypothetical protein